MKRLMGAALSLFLLSACSAPPAEVASSTLAPITGQVAFAQRSTQATITDVALAATVSLISASSGVTAGSTVTTAQGSFTLTFSNGFKPVSGQPYYLDAVKGLSSNRAGEPALRVRTLLLYQPGGWTSLTGLVPGSPIMINSGTTAVSAIASLRGFSASQISGLMGTLDSGGTAIVDNGDVASTEFSTVRSLVQSAMGYDQDPLAAIAYDSTGTTYSMAGTPLFVDSLSPTAGAAGATVTLYGAFPNDVSGLNVLFNGDSTASIGALSADRRQLTVTVPSRPGTGTFPVSVTYGSLSTVGQTFTIQ